jgi:hypothetical protein
MIVNPRDTLTEVNTQCSCGRSPTGVCIGWHNLTEEQFEIRLQQYIDQNNNNTCWSPAMHQIKVFHAVFI